MTKRKTTKQATVKEDKIFSIKNRLSNLEDLTIENRQYFDQQLKELQEKYNSLLHTQAKIMGAVLKNQKACEQTPSPRAPDWYTINSGYIPMPYWWNGERWELWFMGNKYITSYAADHFLPDLIGEKIKTPIGRPSR